MKTWKSLVSRRAWILRNLHSLWCLISKIKIFGKWKLDASLDVLLFTGNNALVRLWDTGSLKPNKLQSLIFSFFFHKNGLLIILPPWQFIDSSCNHGCGKVDNRGVLRIALPTGTLNTQHVMWSLIIFSKILSGDVHTVT